MRITQILFLALIVTACGSSKKVAEQTNEPTIESTQEKTQSGPKVEPNPRGLENNIKVLDIFQRNIDLPMEKAIEKELLPDNIKKRDSIFASVDTQIESHKQLGNEAKVEQLMRFKELVEKVSDKIAKSQMNEEVVEEVVEEMPEDNDIEVTETTLEAIETAFDHDVFDELLKKHVSDKGNVDYKAFKADRTKLKTYLTALSTNMPKEDWKREDILAYWINAYNAFTIKLIIDNYPTKSIKDIKDPWGTRFFKLGKKWYNLNEIEHQILRKMDEPRIHFAINCASVSCPQLFNEAFAADRLEDQLVKATKGFLQDTSRNEITTNQLKVSKIFKWFSKDFKKDGNLIDFLNKYSEIVIADKAKVSYKDYDWNLNE